MLQIIDCQQGEPAWFAARLGIPTTSMFATVMASGKNGGQSLTRRDYLYKLAGEILTGEPMESYSNHHMERGKLLEDEARDYYAYLTDKTPQRVGFIRNGQKGCSPDSLIDENGMLEVKTKLPYLAIDCLLKGEFPPEHKAQCQGALWVAEREWIDITVYWPKIPAFIKKAYRDEAYIRTMSSAVDAFNADLADIVERVKGHDPFQKLEAA